VRWLPLVCAVVLGAGACGGGVEDRPELTVSTASSLQRAFETYGERFDAARVRLNLAGSDQLAAQIRRGFPADVYAAANAELPGALHREGLVERPVPFASNRLVLAVPVDSSRVTSLDDLARPRVAIAIGSSGVPVGSYTRTVLARLPEAQRRAILANVRSEEPDVAGVVGKLSRGAADAGFVYVTDIRSAGGALRAIELPAALRPRVQYAAAVVRRSPHRAAARRFVAGLREGVGARALRDAGFGPPGP
jgi:molybdate transport system substrate-binding protein